MDGKKRPVKEKYHIAAMLLFVFSSLFYISSSIRHGDLVGVMGGFFFFAACIVFLIPYFSRPKIKSNRAHRAEHHRHRL